MRQEKGYACDRKKAMLMFVICEEALMFVICEEALMFVTYEEAIQARTFSINTNVYIVI